MADGDDVVTAPEPSTVRSGRFVVTFDDLFRVPVGWMSWRCLLGWTKAAPGYKDGACRFDHNVDSWDQLAVETAEHLSRWHPHVRALAAPTETAADRSQRLVAVKDGKGGCPVEVWDGPYRFRCSLGRDECGRHGRFAVRPADDTESESQPMSKSPRPGTRTWLGSPGGRQTAANVVLNSNAEGSWDHWVDLALNILADPLTEIVRPDAYRAGPEPVGFYDESQRNLTEDELRARFTRAPHPPTKET